MYLYLMRGFNQVPRKLVDVSEEDIKTLKMIRSEAEWSGKKPTLAELLAEALHEGIVDLDNNYLGG